MNVGVTTEVSRTGWKTRKRSRVYERQERPITEQVAVTGFVDIKSDLKQLYSTDVEDIGVDHPPPPIISLLLVSSSQVDCYDTEGGETVSL